MIGETINWVVKASKLCNLRCRYCYEWPDLARPDRMTLPQWRALFTAVRDYHALRTRATEGPVCSDIIWHGGEPLLLGADYIASVLTLQREILGETVVNGGYYVNALQTNLVRIDEPVLQLLHDHHVQLGVSFDVASGVRLTAGGQTTEQLVARNIDRLRQMGIPFGAITVLGAHTAPRLREIHDIFTALDVGWRVLPMFDAPAPGLGEGLSLSRDDTLAALRSLFAHWLDTPQRIAVEPFVALLGTILRRQRDRPPTPYDRRTVGEWALLVNTDGSLYQVPDAYEPALALGNVFSMSIASILASAPYAASLTRDDARRAELCTGCDWRAWCTTLPAFESTYAGWKGPGCYTVQPLLDAMEAELALRGIDASGVQLLLNPAHALPAGQ